MTHSDFKDLQWLEILLTYKCNVWCEFCYLGNLKWEYKQNMSKGKVLSILEKGYIDGKKTVVFSWWEPTLDENLPFYVEYAKKVWFKHIRVHSNGWKFVDYDYTQDLYEKWMSGVTISIHWYKQVHDSITKYNGSFDIILKSFINFERLISKDKNFSVDTNSIICRKNYKYLKQLLIFLLKFHIKRRMFTYTFDTVLYHNFHELKKVIVSYEELKKPLDSLLEFCQENQIKDFVLDSVPFCLIKEKYWHFIEHNYLPEKFFYLLDYYEGYDNTYNDGKIKYLECRWCKKDAQCAWFSEDNNLLYWKTSFNILT